MFASFRHSGSHQTNSSQCFGTLLVKPVLDLQSRCKIPHSKEKLKSLSYCLAANVCFSKVI